MRSNSFRVRALAAFAAVIVLLAGGMVFAVQQLTSLASGGVARIQAKEMEITKVERLRWSGELTVSIGRGHVDELAERIAQLGGVAEGTVGAVKKRTRLAEYPLTISDGKDHLEALRGGLATFATTTRKSIDVAAEARDADTSDLLTEVSRAADEYLWLVEAHLQGGR